MRKVVFACRWLKLRCLQALAPLALLITVAGCGEPSRELPTVPPFAEARRLAGRQPTDIRFHPAPSMVRVGGPTGLVLPPVADTVYLERALNEWSALQVVLTADTSLLKSADGERVILQWRIYHDEDLPGTTMRNIGPVVYQVFPVHYQGPAVTQDFQVPPGNAGWIPDVCRPFSSNKDGSFFLEPSGEVPATWLLQFPPATIARDDTYTVGLRRMPPADKHLPRPEEFQTLTIHIKTHPVRLPDRFDFMTATTWDWHIDKYLGRDQSADERLAMIDFFLQYRLTPAQFFARGPGFSSHELHRILDGGGTMFQIFHIGGGGNRELTDKQKTQLKPQLEDWRKTMEAAGAADRCYALIADEPTVEAAPVIHRNAEWLKSIWPGLKIWIASRPIPELLDVVDAWDVVTAASTDMYARHSHTAAGLALARGAQTHPQYWWFFSVEPYRPELNCRIDNDLIDSRAIGLLSFITGVDGFEYFWATDWAANAGLNKTPYPDKAVQWDLGLSGAGQLCYPDETNGQLQPIPSLRLVNLRDAFEDWQLFRLAAAKDPGFLSVATQSHLDLKDPATIESLRHKALRVLAPEK